MHAPSTEDWQRTVPSGQRLLAADGVVVAGLLLAGLWFFSHPYQGLMGDALLYAAQALSHLYPNIFRGDIFFVYGSQDDYTLFSRLYARLIQFVGLEDASRTVVALGNMLWLYASWRIAKILPPPQRLAFLALLVSLPGAYATTTFSYGEVLATARIVAEALTLAALAAAIAGRPYLTGALLLVAATQHPLMAFGGILLLALWWGLASRRRLAGAAGILCLVMGEALATTGLLERLTATMDAPWLELIRSRSNFVFISTWQLRDWNLLIINLSLLGAGWRLSRGTPVSRLLLSGLLLGIGALLLASIGVEWWHSQLLIQAQPMRAFWLVKWLALLAFASLLSPRHLNDTWFPLLFATAWLAQDSVGGAIALAALGLAVSSKRRPPLPRLAWLLPVIAAVTWIVSRFGDYYLASMGALNTPGTGAANFFSSLEMAATLFAVSDVVVLFGAMTAWGLHFLWSHGNDNTTPLLKNWLLPMFALAIFGIGLMAFLRLAAAPQPFFADKDSLTLPSSFSARIPETAVVYWQDNLSQTWFALGRRSYYSKPQSAGTLFSRDSSMEMKRRADQLAALGVQDSIWAFRGKEPSPRSLTAMRQALVKLCRDEPLDFVILKTALPEWQEAEWTEAREKTIWRLYDCQRLKREIPQANPGNNDGLLDSSHPFPVQ